MRIDGRTLSHETSETIRRQAVQRVKEGEVPSAGHQGLRTVSDDHLQMAEGGAAGRRGRPRGATASGATARPDAAPEAAGAGLDQWQRPTPVRLRLWLVDPADCGGADAQKFGVGLGVTAVGRLLAELDITPQKPLRRAYERDPAAIERWTTTMVPRLRARAKRVGAKIFFLDEAGVRSDQVLGRTWDLRGQTPEVPTSGRRQSVSAISAVNARGAFWYEIYTEWLNATRFVELLRHFMRSRTSPVFLVLDRHPAHIAKVVAHYVQRLAGRLELHFLPGYAPSVLSARRLSLG